MSTFEEQELDFAKKQALKKVYRELEGKLGVGLRLEKILRKVSCLHDVETNNISTTQLGILSQWLSEIESRTTDIEETLNFPVH